MGEQGTHFDPDVCPARAKKASCKGECANKHSDSEKMFAQERESRPRWRLAGEQRAYSEADVRPQKAKKASCKRKRANCIRNSYEFDAKTELMIFWDSLKYKEGKNSASMENTERQKDMDEKKQIENCYRQMYQGMIEKDRSLLSEALCETFVLKHMSGMRQSKEAFIRAVEDGTLNYYSAVHQRMEIKMDKQAAVLIGQSLVNAAVFGGGRHTWRLQLRCHLIQENDTWRIAEAEASTY